MQDLCKWIFREIYGGILLWEEKIKKQNLLEIGEGSLYYSEKLKLWVFQYVYNGKRNSIKQRKKETVRSFKSRVTTLKNKLNTGLYIENTKETLLSILEHHIEQKLEDGVTQETSYAREKDTLEQIKICCNDFINKSIQKVTVEDIEKSKSQIRNYSKSCIDKIWRLLNKGFKIAYSRRKIVYNIMEDDTLTKPISKKISKPVEALTTKEEQKLISSLYTAPNELYNKIILLQLYTGARIGEILALSRDCINLKNNTIHIYRTLTKNTKGEIILGKHTKTFCKKTGIDSGKRTFPMKPEVRQIINEILDNKITNIYNLIFWDYNKNTFIKPYAINSYLYRLNNSNHICNFSLSSHNLRHTFITRCQEQGMSLVVLQSLVGHVEGSSITNNIYTSVSIDFMKQELEKIN